MVNQKTLTVREKTLQKPKEPPKLLDYHEAGSLLARNAKEELL
jgi:hypothetical protein